MGSLRSEPKKKKKVKSTDWAEVLEGGIEFRRSCGVMASGFRPTLFFLYTHISTTTTTSVCVHEGLHTEGEDNGKGEKPNNGSSGIFKKKNSSQTGGRRRTTTCA